MSLYNQPTYKLKERLYENCEKTIVIFRTRRKKTIKYIAVKVYYKIKHPFYNREYSILKNISCPSIVNVTGASEDKNNFYMEMEYCASGDLSHCLWPNKGSNYLEKVIKTVSTQLLLGLRTLHMNGIIHCNLKPSNILIDEFGNVRICDFKKALKMNEMTIQDIKKNKTAMTPCYTAPELFSDEGEYSFKTDFWALGCIMYEMAVGQVPFFDEVVNKLIKKIINEEVNFNKKQFNQYSEEFMDAIKKLLEKDPEKRPTWGEIENFSFWNTNEKNFYNYFNDTSNNISSTNINNNSNNNLINNSNVNSNINIFNNSFNSNNNMNMNNITFNNNLNNSNKNSNNLSINSNKNSNISFGNHNNHSNNNANNRLLSGYSKSPFGSLNNGLDNINKINMNNNNSNISSLNKQGSISPKLSKNSSKRFSRQNKQFEINEDESYTNRNHDYDIDENDREFRFNNNHNDNDSNINEEESYSAKKFNTLIESQNKNLLSLSVLNVSKIVDKQKDKKINASINDMTLSLANPEELPQLQYLMIHNSDKNVKPLIGNKVIEHKRAPVIYDESKIPLKPLYKLDRLKEIIRDENFKELEKFLKNLFFAIDDYNRKQKFDLLLNILNYFESIILSKDVSNNIINTPFMKLFIDFLEINDDKIRIRSCSIIAYLIRYSTNLNFSLDKFNISETLISFISDTNLELNRKAMSTLGEYLFFVSTQVEVELDQVKKGLKPTWSISQESLKSLLFALNHIDEKVRFYSLKTIENICTLTTVAKRYFASNDDFIIKIIDIINFSCENPEIKTSAISTVSHIIRHNPSLMKIFINKMDKINVVIENEVQKNQQYIINCLLFGIEGDKKNIKYINKDELMPTLINLLDNSNNVIKGKVLILLCLIFNDIFIITKYGEPVFTLIQKLRKDKKNYYYHVKIFEDSLMKYCESLIKLYKNIYEEEEKNKHSNNNINSNNIDSNNDRLLSLLKCFNAIAPYHKVSHILYNKDFLNTTINILFNCNVNSLKAEQTFELLKAFSENSFSVQENCDFIINKIFVKILSLTTKLNDEYRRFPLNICANIISVLLEDDKLYSSTAIEEGKTDQINNLIINILPDIYELLTNQDTVYDSLSFLSLIIERNVAFIRFYRSIGIIEYIFLLMKEENFYSNLNLIKILIKLIESNETTFKDIIDFGLIDKINYLIAKDNPEEITIYTEYVIEMFFDLMFKINEMKRKYTTNHNKDDVQKNFTKKIEGVAANFGLSIKLLGCDNYNLQEKSCINLIFILQFFQNYFIQSLNTNVEFVEDDIPYLLKALDSGNKKIHKKMIKIFKWIIGCQKNARIILKNYVSYIQICIEKIMNTSDEPDVLEIANSFLQQDLIKVIK